MNEQVSVSVIERLAVLQESVTAMRGQIAQIGVSGEKRDTELRSIDRKVIEVDAEMKSVKSDLGELKDDAKWLWRGIVGQIIAIVVGGLVYAVTHWPR